MKRSFKDKLLDATYRGGKERYKADVQAIKDDFRGLKQDLAKKDAELEVRNAERERKVNEKLAKMRENSKEAPSLREAFAEDREKRRKKEAERNPGMFMRVWSGTTSILLLILSVPLTLSIIGIPFAIGLIALAIYFWRKDVIKKPYEYKPKEDNNNVRN